MPNETYRRPTRRGFVLIAVLWLLVLVSALLLAQTSKVRIDIRREQNRGDGLRAEWAAEGCAESLRASMDAMLADSSRGSSAADDVWRHFDARLRSTHSYGTSACRWRLTPVATRLDVNTVPPLQLMASLARSGVTPAIADSMVDALLDWRDTDDEPRSHGAERAWYVRHGRVPPANSTFTDVDEITRVRGFERYAELGDLLGVEPGRICLLHASPIVLAALPGSSEELVHQIVQERELRGTVSDVLQLAGRIPLEPRRRLINEYQSFMRQVRYEPEAWMLEVSAKTGDGGVERTLIERLTRAGYRVATVRSRRGWT